MQAGVDLEVKLLARGLQTFLPSPISLHAASPPLTHYHIVVFMDLILL